MAETAWTLMSKQQDEVLLLCLNIVHMCVYAKEGSQYCDRLLGLSHLCSRKYEQQHLRGNTSDLPCGHLLDLRQGRHV